MTQRCTHLARRAGAASGVAVAEPGSHAQTLQLGLHKQHSTASIARSVTHLGLCAGMVGCKTVRLDTINTNRTSLIHRPTSGLGCSRRCTRSNSWQCVHALPPTDTSSSITSTAAAPLRSSTHARCTPARAPRPATTPPQTNTPCLRPCLLHTWPRSTASGH